MVGRAMGYVGVEQLHEHHADVAEAALAEHRCAIRKRSDGVRRILRSASGKV
jgi:hypothetical protein